MSESIIRIEGVTVVEVPAATLGPDKIAALAAAAQAAASATQTTADRAQTGADTQTTAADRAAVHDDRLAAEGSAVAANARVLHDNTTAGTVDYIGRAPHDSSTASGVWTITRLTVASSGSVTTAKASNAKWDDRLTLTYT